MPNKCCKVFFVIFCYVCFFLIIRMSCTAETFKYRKTSRNLSLRKCLFCRLLSTLINFQCFKPIFLRTRAKVKQKFISKKKFLWPIIILCRNFSLSFSPRVVIAYKIFLNPPIYHFQHHLALEEAKVLKKKFFRKKVGVPKDINKTKRSLRY